MAVAAFVLVIVVLLGNAGAVYWLYQRGETRAAVAVDKDKALHVWAVGQFEAIHAAMAYKPKAVDPSRPKAAPRPSGGGWIAIKNDLERGNASLEGGAKSEALKG